MCSIVSHLLTFTTLLMLFSRTAFCAALETEDCLLLPDIEFGIDLRKECYINFMDCSMHREEIVSAVMKESDKLKSLDDGTGVNIQLLMNETVKDNDESSDNSSETLCNGPLAVQLKILYVPTTFRRDFYKIVGAFMTLENAFFKAEDKLNFSWNVYFSEVTPNSKLSRWWQEMTSRKGSSENLFWANEGLLPDDEPHGPYIFNLLLYTVILLLFLSPYY